MPGTAKKRKRKQRGTQGGRVGGRRSRPRSRAEAKAQARSRGTKGSAGKQRMADRVGAPPTWRGAVNRALIASGIFLALLLIFFKQPAPQALALSAFMLLVYIPMGYYMDRFFYRMKLRKEEKKRLEAKAEKGQA
ncbi:MAG TPA: hypothetical protein VFY99_01925 [Solirubrobacterales bacterium]